MRRYVPRIVLALLVVGVLVAVGVVVYNTGVAAGVAQSGLALGRIQPIYRGLNVHPGLAGLGFGLRLGFLGLLVPIFLVLVIVGTVWIALGWSRGRDRGAPGWDPSARRDAWPSDRDAYLAELHRRLHEAEDAPPSDGTPTHSAPSA